MTPTNVGNTRPTDAELVAMLRKAAELIRTLCHKDIRKSFHEQNFAANTLGKAARALEAASADKTGSLHRPNCSPDCSRHHRMTNEAPYNDEPYTVSGVDYTFRFAINQRKPIGQFAAAVARSASATVPPALVVPEAEQEPQRVADSQWNETEHDFARDEAASAIVRAVQRWREALAGMSNNDIDNALDAVWEAGETLDALRED